MAASRIGIRWVGTCADWLNFIQIVAFHGNGRWLNSLRPPALLLVLSTTLTRSTCHFLLERPLNFADNLQFCRRAAAHRSRRHRALTANPDFKTLSQLVVCRPASLQSLA